jgi:hypothetical protein
MFDSYEETIAMQAAVPIRSIPCTFCGAKEGDECKTRGGQIIEITPPNAYDTYHEARHYAQAAFWKGMRSVLDSVERQLRAKTWRAA